MKRREFIKAGIVSGLALTGITSFFIHGRRVPFEKVVGIDLASKPDTTSVWYMNWNEESINFLNKEFGDAPVTTVRTGLPDSCKNQLFTGLKL